MKISTIIPWKDNGDLWRLRAFARVLQQWKTFLGGHGNEIITCANQADPFERVATLNVGVTQSTGDIVIIADADTIFQPWALAEAIAVVHSGKQWALPYTVYYNADQYWTLDYLTDNFVDPFEAPPKYEHMLTNSVSGVVVLSREMWNIVGGYDHRFHGWGYEDNAFAHTLDVLVGSCYRASASVIHLWHERGLDFKQPNIDRNRLLCNRYLGARTKAQVQTIIEER